MQFIYLMQKISVLVTFFVLFNFCSDLYYEFCGNISARQVKILPKILLRNENSNVKFMSSKLIS